MSLTTISIDNRSNVETTIYVMEKTQDDYFSTPSDLAIINGSRLSLPTFTDPATKELIDRFVRHQYIGGTEFPSPIQEIRGSAQGSIQVADGTTDVKCWTYDNSNKTWANKGDQRIVGQAVPIPELAPPRR